MRTVVKVNEGRHPELYSELEQLDDPYGRAERLRMLATIGLRGLNSGELSGGSGDESRQKPRGQTQPRQVRSPKQTEGKAEQPGRQRSDARPPSQRRAEDDVEPEQSDEDTAVRQSLLSGMASQF